MEKTNLCSCGRPPATIHGRLCSECLKRSRARSRGRQSGVPRSHPWRSLFPVRTGQESGVSAPGGSDETGALETPLEAPKEASALPRAAI